tara:strand:- start:4858 stop:5589 length:732 start_codon:yes stop_codon:yes gene_type:complete
MNIKAVYIHIPKTGGTSFKKVFKPFINDCVVTEQSNIIKEQSNFGYNDLLVLNFKKSDALRKKEALGEEAWDNAFKFAIVRNPWDRYVSNWKWLTRKEKLFPKKGWRARGWHGMDGEITFEDFVKQMDVCYLNLKRLHGYQHDKWHLRNQIEHIVDYDGNIIIDHIGRFENLQEEYKFICDKIQLPEIQLPYLNHFGHYSAEVKVHDPKKIHYSTYYNDELVEIVSKRCKEDIVKFDYKFEWK